MWLRSSLVATLRDAELLNIDKDLGRFRDIIKGRVRKDLRKYMSSGELLGRQGKKTVSIPIHQIGIPRLRYGENKKGLGQGEDGEEAGEGQKAGDATGEHLTEIEFTVEELAELLGEELQLPKIEPKGSKDANTVKLKYTGISPTGPESLRHFKRTYRRALQRLISTGEFVPEKPVIVPIREDKRYRSCVTQTEPRSAAVILYMMDVSGSMGNEQKEIVRSTVFWIDAWIKHNYKDVDTRFIIHDAAAKEVDRDTFFHTRESGGTLISSAYRLALEIIERDYPVNDWNIYPFHFSDGDNWSHSDTAYCIRLLQEKLIPMSNQFGYAQVDSTYGSGAFIKDLELKLNKESKVALATIPDRDGIFDAIKALLSGGR